MGITQLSYWGVSGIAERMPPIQSRNPGQALRDMKKEFSELEEEKELAVWSKKLADPYGSRKGCEVFYKQKFRS